MPVFVAERQAVTRYIPVCASSVGESYTTHVVACSSLCARAEASDIYISVSFPAAVLFDAFFTRRSRLDRRFQ